MSSDRCKRRKRRSKPFAGRKERLKSRLDKVNEEVTVNKNELHVLNEENVYLR